jgi:hypothetical protein
MKALKLSTICAFLLILSACTKDVDTLSTSNSSLSETSEAQLSNNKVAATGGGQSGGSGASGVTGGASIQGNGDVAPALTILYSSPEGTVGQPITVTGTFASGQTAPTCGKLQIQELINGQWVAKAVDTDGNGTPDAENVNVTSIIDEVNYTFTPTVPGTPAHNFRVHYIGANCRGFANSFSTGFPLNVVAACVQSFDIQKGATAVNNGDGTYDITITYILTSPKDVTGVKFQGGATSGGQEKHEMVDYGNTKVVHNNNQNTVLKWEGDLVACQPQTVNFTYKRKFECPATNAVVTGNWTAKQGETLLADPVQVTYSCPQ